MRYVTYAANAVVPPQQQSPTDTFVTAMQKSIRQNPLILIIAGAFGLIARPPFKFQDKGVFHILYKGGSLLSILLGAYGYATNGHKLIGS